MVVPFGWPDGCVRDGTGEACVADGDAASPAGGEEAADEGPSGVAVSSDTEFGGEEEPHPTSSRQTRRTKARTFRVCAELTAKVTYVDNSKVRR